MTEKLKLLKCKDCAIYPNILRLPSYIDWRFCFKCPQCLKETDYRNVAAKDAQKDWNKLNFEEPEEIIEFNPTNVMLLTGMTLEYNMKNWPTPDGAAYSEIFSTDVWDENQSRDLTSRIIEKLKEIKNRENRDGVIAYISEEMADNRLLKNLQKDVFKAGFEIRIGSGPLGGKFKSWDEFFNF